MAAVWRTVEDGLELRVKVTPRAKRDELGGVVEDAEGALWLAARVTAAPEGGKANEAILKLVAKRLQVPASALEITAGHTARWKRIHVSGLSAALEERASSLHELTQA